MKKTILLASMLILSVFLLASCGGSSEGNEGKVKVVTTIFPEYDWVNEILGDAADNADVTLLLDNGTDLHSYQPTASDLMKISSCDVFIYVGGESDEWVEDALEDAKNKDMKVVCLLDVLGSNAKTEEVVEGMQVDDHDDADSYDDEEYDEHVWLSLRNAEKCVDSIAVALADADPANADTYRSNAAGYIAKLEALDAEYERAVASARVKTLVFGDRFPFRYLTDDYGLSYYAAFVGCSAETEASFKTIAFLANKADELGVKAIMTIDKSDGKIAETVIRTAKSKNLKVLALNSMQSVGSKEVANGVSYLAIMEDNLKVLKEALS